MKGKKEEESKLKKEKKGVIEVKERIKKRKREANEKGEEKEIMKWRKK